MESYVFVLILVGICVVSATQTSCPFESTPSILVLAQRVSDCTAEEIQNYFGRQTSGMFRKMNRLYETIENLEKSLDSTDFYSLQLPILSYVVTINVQDINEIFRELLQDETDFGNIINNRTNSMARAAGKLHKFVVSDDNTTSLIYVSRLLVEDASLQNEIVRIKQQSPKQWFHNLCNTIALAQIKYLVTHQLSYMLKSYKGRSEEDTVKYHEGLKTLVEKVKIAMPKIPGEYWRRDPKEYKRDENYLEITRLSQGYLVNEISLKQGSKCFGECETFKEMGSINCNKNSETRKDESCSSKRQCKGKLYDCVSLKSMEMSVCPTSYNSPRRYDYIEYKDHTLLGQKSSCSQATVTYNTIERCAYCMCFCDDDSSSDRYISLRRAFSDTEANKVVTGVRFVKANRIIHLQVQQGEMLPHGIINASTLEWVPINNFKILDRYISNGRDYLKLNRSNNAMDLHVNEVTNERPKRVITGIRFFVLKMESNSHLNFEIRETAFDFTTGKLYPTSNQWTENLQTEFSSTNRREKISIEDVDVPTRATTENTVRSKGNQYIKFTPSSIEKDAAQTTVPFIDAQDVVPATPTPLIGAGVYYKATENYGGFIGLKIVTYDPSTDL
ncbi:hypothetical protein Trydic_g23860 [Trypoxylus dichotomus]